jgi:predicted alpha/beta-fold hydrolase
LRPFVPFFRNSHLSTLAGNFWPRVWDEARFPSARRLYKTAPNTQVLVEENQPAGPPAGEVILVHGLEGSSRSGYLVSLAHCLVEAGFRVHRLNLRGCGGTEHLTDTLYHSGLTDDLLWLLRHLQAEGRGPVFLAGFSLGGNVVLKLAGELGAGARGLLAGVCAACTPIDLHACVRRMGDLENRLYEWRFVLSLRQRYELRHKARPERFPIEGLKGAWSVFDFDNQITAPHFGFGDAPNYYATQSAIHFIPQIQIPTLLIQCENDPLIPFALFRSQSVASNPNVELLAVQHGGHLGLIAKDLPRFWADDVIRDWLLHARNNSPASIVLK